MKTDGPNIPVQQMHLESEPVDIPIDISVIIPVFNSELQLPELFERLTHVLRSMKRKYEIVFIDDGSRDNSWQQLLDFQNANPSIVTAVQLMRNFGQHNAIMCGFEQCTGNIVITMDDDLQNPPEEIPNLVKAIESENLDLVYGIYRQKQHHLFRNIGSSLSQLFYRRVFNLKNGVSAFRAIRRPIVESVKTYQLNYTYLDGLFAWNTTRIGEVFVKHDARATGESGYSIKSLFLLATNLFTNFSLIPLQLVSLTGTLMALVGFLAGAYYLYARIVNNIEVPGFASVMIAIFTFSGIQLLSMGVIGEYLGRLHINVNRKPQYVARHTLRRIATHK